MELCKRQDVPVEQTWDLSLIFKEEKDMWDALEKVKADVKAFVGTYAGRLSDAETIVNCLDDMEKGGSEHPMALYKKFMGRKPKTDALLRRNGIIK